MDESGATAGGESAGEGQGKKKLLDNIFQDVLTLRFIRRKSRREDINPVTFVVLSFLAIIVLGTLLLWLPFSAKEGGTNFVDAFFTATSATCVTGLVVKDTAMHFSLFGQIVILLLIQLGGLGYMTITTFFALLIGRRLGFSSRLILKEHLNMSSLAGVFKLARRVLFFVLSIELIGALILFFRWRDLGTSFWGSVKLGVFHAVSAFNNAGFDVIGRFRSLTSYVGDPWILFTISFLIIAGGLGFIVLSNLYEALFYKKRINLQTKIVLVASVMLIIIGALLILSFENTNSATLGSLSGKEKVYASYFQSVTARTAGFNTINIGGMTLNGLMVLIILMFIGASPGGTGGGIKTVTFAVVLAAVIAFVKGKKETEMSDRSIDDALVMKSMTIFILSLFLILGVTFLLCAFNDFLFFQNLFEATSAFGTVGLSTGITSMLNIPSKIIIALTIFIGRVGILSFILSLYATKNLNKIRLPKEELSVG
ncbi:Trk family potassium uptake protein [Candidatus Woesearchaeota archaeon]|nr:Trk family potassium uptake protein [Candidatus Woesearchaeota archaeon]